MAHTEEGNLNPRRSGYPWDEWFDGRVWVLSQEDGDFDVDVESFRSTVKAAAIRRGHRVITQSDPSGGILRIQKVGRAR